MFKASTIRYTPLLQAQWYLILAGFSERKTKKKKTLLGQQILPGCPLMSGHCFAFFKHTQINN